MSRAVLMFVLLLLSTACKKSIPDEAHKQYLKRGQEIAKITEQTLSKTLMEKLQQGGIPEAVSYCNTRALHLTDSMAEFHGVRIKRTALRLRNQQNTPNDAERKILQLYKDRLAYDEPLEHIVEKGPDGSINFYAPILAKQKCLMCHGSLGKELAPVTDSIIKSFYPNDLATGFEENDLRGIWSIQFNKGSS